MPEFISLRSFRLASTTGHSVIFEAGVPREIPDALVSEAMAAGCAPASKDDVPFYDDLAKSKVEFSGDIRRSMIYLAVSAVAKENNPKNFDGGGVPRAAVLTDRLGFDVPRKDAIAIFQEYLNIQANGGEFPMHPSAKSIERVVNAEDRAELLELAEEFDVSGANARGLSVRELRKMLLVKFDGTVAKE